MSDTLTNGAVLVAVLAKRLGASAMARKLGLTEAAVRSHATGQAVPRPGARERYLAAYDVPLDAWGDAGAATLPQDAPASAPPPPMLPSGSSGPPGAAMASSDDAREAVVDLLRVARAQLEAAQLDKDVPYRERAQLITSATGLCRLLARLSGSLDVTEVAIVRSTHWRRLMDLLDGVLAKHPEAAKAWAAKLGEVDG
jgi:hypothetical protein